MIEVAKLAAAIALAVVLLVAAQAKLRRFDQVTSDFDSLGLVGAAALARLVPLAEAISAVALVVAPGVGGPLAFALLAAFTAVLFRAQRFAGSGSTPSCACFGGTSTQPISGRHFLRNAILMGLALAATAADGRLIDLVG